MLCDTKLSLLIRSEHKASASIFLYLESGLPLGWIIHRLAFVDLLLNEAVEEAEAQVEVLGGDLALCERDAEDQVSAIVGQLRCFVLDELVLLGALLDLEVATVQVIRHHLLHVLVLLETERAMQLSQGE